MDSEISMNTTVDPSSTFLSSAEANRTSHQSPSIPYATVSYAKATVFWAIFVVGASGNLLVVAVGVKGHGSGNKGQTLVTRMFICCLAVSDLGVMLTGTWTSAMTAINPSWSFGSLFCRLNSLWTSMASKMSACMMSVIGFDRSDNHSSLNIFIISISHLLPLVLFHPSPYLTLIILLCSSLLLMSRVFILALFIWYV